MCSIKYSKGYKYRIEGRYISPESTGVYPPSDIVTKFITLRKSGILIIEDGYASDGASGTTFDTKSSMRGSFEHDALCQLVRERYLPDSWMHAINKRAHKVWLQDRMLKVRAWYWYRAIETDIAENIAKKPKKIYTAP